MALCNQAWRIITDGLYPFQEYSTPAVVGECGKKQHDSLLKIVNRFFEKRGDCLTFKMQPRKEYLMKVNRDSRRIIVKPDAYALLQINNLLVNIVVEVTTRGDRLISPQWLVASAIPFYLENMCPTFVLLVTPREVRILPLNTEGLERLKFLLENPPKRRKEAWICSNCDLRAVCPDPAV